MGKTYIRCGINPWPLIYSLTTEGSRITDQNFSDCLSGVWGN
jgi:hypothetical protein